jgi:hypothetical protein
VAVVLDQKNSESFHLPADVEFRVQGKLGSYLFKSRENSLLFPSAGIDLIHEKGALYFGIDRLPSRYNPRFYFDLEETHQTRQGRWSVLGGKAWTPVSVIDRCSDFTQSGFIQFFLADEDLRPSELGGKERLWFRFEAEKSEDFIPVRNIYANVVECQNLRSFSELCLGSGDATASQSFSLPAGQITKDFEVKVFNGEKACFEKWERSPNFFLSQETSKHFVFDEKTSRIVFGDGFRGRKLPPGYDNVWVESLSLCDGSASNLSRESSVQLEADDWRVAETRLMNDIRGGVDLITGDNQLRRLRNLLVSQNRAVNLSDYENIATELTPRVGRAYAQKYKNGVRLFPLLRPVYARKGGQVDFSPERSDLEFLTLNLEDRKLLNTKLFVLAPNYRSFQVEATVYVRDLNAETRAELCELVLDYFSPYGSRSSEVFPGMSLNREALHQELEKQPRVLAIKNLRLIDDKSKICIDHLMLEPNELPSIQLSLRFEERMR